MGGYIVFVFFFFFQAEDGIRDLIVTGVQTCALPISRAELHLLDYEPHRCLAERCLPAWRRAEHPSGGDEIGRASGRGRGEISVVAVSLKKKKKKEKRKVRVCRRQHQNEEGQSHSARG